MEGSGQPHAPIALPLVEWVPETHWIGDWVGHGSRSGRCLLTLLGFELTFTYERLKPYFRDLRVKYSLRGWNSKGNPTVNSPSEHAIRDLNISATRTNVQNVMDNLLTSVLLSIPKASSCDSTWEEGRDCLAPRKKKTDRRFFAVSWAATRWGKPLSSEPQKATPFPSLNVHTSTI
jgi:hypothetical protein